MEISNMPLISVIICTYNRAKFLKRCLTSLFNQNISRTEYEVIVVDNDSKDSTQKLVKQYSKNFDNIKYIIEKRIGLSYARNKSYSQTIGQYLAYIDDDAVVPYSYLSNIKKIINKYKPDILGGPVYPYYTSPKPYWFKDEYEIRRYTKTSGFSKSCQISGSNFVIKKNILKKLGMFDTDFGVKGKEMGLGEERLILEKYRQKILPAKQKVYYSLKSKILHHVPPYKMKIVYLLKRSYLGGRMLAKIEKIINPNKTKEKSNIIVYGSKYFRLIGEVVIAFIDDLRKQKRDNRDYLDLLRLACFRLGLRIEKLNN